MSKVAINGMGRIGRAAFKIILEQPELELVAVNDLMALDNLVYLLNYDTVYGRYQHRVAAAGEALKVAGKTIKFLSVNGTRPNCPGKALGVDIVFECTGLFTQVRWPEQTPGGRGQVRGPVGAPQGRGGLLHRPRGHQAGGRRSHDLLRLLHHQLHHPGGGDHGPADRRQKGDHDHHPRLHLLPGHCGRAQQEISPGPGRGGQPGAHLHRGGEGHHQYPAPIQGEIRRGVGALPGALRVPWPIWFSSPKGPTTVEEINAIFKEEAASDAIEASWNMRWTPSSPRISSQPPRLHLRPQHDPGGGRRPGQGHELVRQRMGLYQSDDPGGPAAHQRMPDLLRRRRGGRDLRHPASILRPRAERGNPPLEAIVKPDFTVILNRI